MRCAMTDEIVEIVEQAIASAQRRLDDGDYDWKRAAHPPER